MFKISTNRVQDVVRVSEGKRHLDLTVDVDPYSFVPALKAAQDRLSGVGDQPDDSAAQVVQAAQEFAATMFGKEQSRNLLAFYDGHAAPVISICTQYLKARLVAKIRRAQRARR